MTRVSTFQQSQLLLNDMLQNQQAANKAQRQVSTGHVADFYKDIYQDTASLTGAKSLLARLEQHKENSGVIKSTLFSYDQALGGLEKAGTDVKEAVIGAINSSTALGFDAAIEGAFEATMNFLNSQTSEGYLFSGSKQDTSPLNITQVSDLLAAAEPPTDIFVNNSLKKTIKIDENRSIELGILADDVGLEIMTAIQRIVLWQNGTVPSTAPVPAGPAGPASTPLSASDQAFLTGEIANLEDLVKNLAEKRGINGLNQKIVDETLVSLDAQIDQSKVFISNIEDVDAAEAITNLNQKNFALEASYNVLSQVNRLSLLNFLR
ncbi:flagellin [Sneathiella sp.]|jgi:flagellar hook-associated protein 3 FlgL|uniref:flagellin n=1 Tax=Sneathiella sp. TaxID=1964365 RepID=UPI0039E3460A